MFYRDVLADYFHRQLQLSVDDQCLDDLWTKVKADLVKHSRLESLRELEYCRNFYQMSKLYRNELLCSLGNVITGTKVALSQIENSDETVFSQIKSYVQHYSTNKSVRC